MKRVLNSDYWENRYQAGTTSWDIGAVSTPMQAYIDQIADKSLHILIPGAGNGYEAIYLMQQGFTNITVLDIAATPLQNLQEIHPEFKVDQLVHTNFFEHQATYDLILEQTFFCALSPELRPAYMLKMHELLTPKGKLAGLLFDFPLTEAGPPYGGSPQEYSLLSKPYFTTKTLEPCYNSIKPRRGKELFFIFDKQNSTTF